MSPYSLLPDRRVVGHQLAVGRLAREADDDDPARLDAGDHAVAELGVHDVLADAEDRSVTPGAGLRRRGRGAGPRGDPPRRREAARDPRGLVGELLRELVEEA